MAAVGTTGSVDEVQPHTSSEEAASSGVPATRARLPARSTTDGSATKAADDSGVRPDTTICAIAGRIASIASMCPLAWTPVPNTPSEVASGRAR